MKDMFEVDIPLPLYDEICENCEFNNSDYCNGQCILDFISCHP